jgi:hypothetical protein
MITVAAVDDLGSNRARLEDHAAANTAGAQVERPSCLASSTHVGPLRCIPRGVDRFHAPPDFHATLARDYGKAVVALRAVAGRLLPGSGVHARTWQHTRSD